MAYFIDYKGQIAPADTDREHIGVFSISSPTSDRMIMLRPGLQEVSDDLWNAIRSHKQVGYNPRAKRYDGELVARGILSVYEPNENGEMDWAKHSASLDSFARRTTIVAILNSMLAFVETKKNLTFLAARLRKHIENCSTGFDDKPIPPAQLVPILEVA